MVKSLLTVIAFLCMCISVLGERQELAANRHVKLEGQANFRDVGGYQTSDGKTVRRQIVYRSGELPRLTANDVVKLEQLGIGTCVSFLTDQETKVRGKNRLPRGVREVQLPIESDGGWVSAVNKARETANFAEVPPELNPKLHRVLVNEAKDQYAVLLKELANADEPIVFHCSHGVHRTGTATAILLWALGVPWEKVREDYLLSNTFRKPEVNASLERLRDLAAKTQDVPPEEVDMTNINAFYILQGEYIDAARDEILQKHGSIAAYLREGLGLNDGDIQKLRERLLE